MPPRSTSRCPYRAGAFSRASCNSTTSFFPDEVLAYNAPDNEQAPELVEQSEENAGLEVDETMGNCAFGDGLTRQGFYDAGRKLASGRPACPDIARAGDTQV